MSHQTKSRIPLILGVVFAAVLPVFSEQPELTVSSLGEFARAAREDGRRIRLKPGLYRMADFLTDEEVKALRSRIDRSIPRPPVPMLEISGNGNHLNLEGVTLEIDNGLYRKLPPWGYTRCVMITGNGNVLRGLSIRHTGPDVGSGGNTLSVMGTDNTLEDVTLHVRGSFPYGYGDLLGKGVPHLVHLKKQSGIQVVGSRSTLRRCRVFSRAFGHCFYIQEGDGIRLEDCYAEGEMRSTSSMLADRSGPAFERGFRSVYQNRSGRFSIVPGYMKSLSEDGFRSYKSAGSVTFVDCTAVNTRAGFEVNGRPGDGTRSMLDKCVARGCERAFLIGGPTVVRRSRGDAVHGPLLYLVGDSGSDVELELIGDPPESVVHLLATISGRGHRVRLEALPSFERFPSLPIFVGFGMPMHGEMASEPLPAPTRDIELVNRIGYASVVTSDRLEDVRIETDGCRFEDAELRKGPGPWEPSPGDRSREECLELRAEGRPRDAKSGLEHAGNAPEPNAEGRRDANQRN